MARPDAGAQGASGAANHAATIESARSEMMDEVMGSDRATGET